MLTPWPMQAMIDYALGSRPVPKWLAMESRERLLIAIVGAGILAQIGHHVVMMIHTRLQASTGQHMTRDIRARMFAHLQGLALVEHAKMPKGDSVYRLESDAPCLERVIFEGLFPLTFSAVTLVVMLTILIRINGTIALAAVLVVPLMYLWLRIHTREMRSRVDHTKKLESKLTQRMYESFSSIRLIKTFAREPHEETRFRGVAEQAMRANIELGRKQSVFSLVIAILMVLGNAVVLVIGGIAAMRGTITIGTLLVAVAYLAYVYGPLSAIAHTTGSLQRALASAGRVREVFALMPESAEQPGETQLSSVKGEIRFENVSFSYDDGPPVLNNVTFTANPGETIALVGASGAGKTTLASLVPRMYEIDSGRILIDGVNVRNYSLSSLRSQVSVVLQDAILMSGTIRDNLRFGRLNASDDEIVRAATAANAHEFITRLPKGYDSYLAEGGAELSGGQRQRLSIARAFLKDSSILILDEPTSALDTVSEVLILEALQRLRAGRTTFVIAHRLSTVREADRILVMAGGKIVGEGKHEELLETTPLYRQLCRRIYETEGEEILADAQLVTL